MNEQTENSKNIQMRELGVKEETGMNQKITKKTYEIHNVCR